MTTGEFQQFLGIARGANLEVQTQLEIARAVNLADEQPIAHVQSLSVEVGKMINAILRSLREKRRVANH